MTINQLLGDEYSFGGTYRISSVKLKDTFPRIPDFAFTTPLEQFEAINPNRRATLQQLNLFALFNHPSGFFASAEALWSRQDNNQSSLRQVERVNRMSSTNLGVGDDDFWQLNARIGYRFRRNLAEISIGVLNITDQNYTLNPLNLYEELPRERTVLVRAKINF